MKKIVWICVCLCVLISQSALAHKVIVFAWVENGIVYTESSFGSKRKAKDSLIVVKDDDGSVVTQGRTDDEGNFSFQLPKGIDSDLHITLEAGTGHKANWTIPKQELEQGDQTATDLAQSKQRFQGSPSLIRIIAGIGIIALLAAIAKYLARRKNKDD